MNQEIKDRYESWLASDFVPTSLKDELRDLTDEAEIEDRFYCDLEFGTAGLRGVIGAGTNRINALTVAAASRGLAEFVKESIMAETGAPCFDSVIEEGQRPSVCIAYDTRRKSREFAFTAASVLNREGVAAYIYENVRPTPMLSFAVRYLKASAGIVITASHNPAEYNGFKVYNSYGGQMTDSDAKKILSYIRRLNVLSPLPSMSCFEGDSVIGSAENSLNMSAADGQESERIGTKSNHASQDTTTDAADADVTFKNALDSCFADVQSGKTTDMRSDFSIKSRETKGYELAKFESENAKGLESLIKTIGSEVEDAYYARVKAMCARKDLIREWGSKLHILYTPLNGTGSVPVRRVLSELGFTTVDVVPEQTEPDENFITVPKPNPEELSVYAYAIKQSENSTNPADIIIATDPDCDRIGIVEKNACGEYEVLSGNQSGALLCDYVIKTFSETGTMPENPTVIKTIVTSCFTDSICEASGVKVRETLTGFKYIAELMESWETPGFRLSSLDSRESGASFNLLKKQNFIFGFEESYGYLAGTFVRDKDAVVAAALIAEMALYYKRMGMTLHEALLSLYKEHGYFADKLLSISMPGIEGKSQIKDIMKRVRSFADNVEDGGCQTAGESEFACEGGFSCKQAEADINELHGAEQDLQAKTTIVDEKESDFEESDKTSGISLETSSECPISAEDYALGIKGLPKSDVLKFRFSDGSWAAFRPSGTEPKIKIYIGVKALSEEAAQERLNEIESAVYAIAGL